MKNFIFNIILTFVIVLLLSLTINELLFYKNNTTPTDDGYRERNSVASLEWFASGIRVYFVLHGTFPPDHCDLRQSLESGGVFFGNGTTNFCFAPVDSWGTGFRYEVAGQTATVCSAGVDRKFETKDDIVCTVVIRDKKNTIWGIQEKEIFKCSKKVGAK